MIEKSRIKALPGSRMRFKNTSGREVSVDKYFNVDSSIFLLCVVSDEFRATSIIRSLVFSRVVGGSVEGRVHL